MDDVFKVVPKLETLAISAAYKAIEADLRLCYGHNPAGVRFYRDCAESDQIRHRVRSRLDQILVGIVSDRVRQHFRNLITAVTADHWLFLDCVLCETCTSISGAEASYQLTSVIGKRSPSLTKLDISFLALYRVAFSPELQLRLSAVVRPLASLNFLKDLCLSGMKSSISTSVMGLLGESCPSLSSLTIEHGYGNVETDMLALIMGRFLYFIQFENQPSWFKHGQLGRIDVPPEYRTPICSTLRVLNYDSLEWSAALTAFTLRNMLLLQKLDSSALCGGIKMLHHQQHQGMNNSLQGQLSLTEIDEVNVKSGSVLRAIRDLCPSLNEVSFSDSYPSRQVKATDLVSPSEAEAILRKWPKLATTKCDSVSREYVKCILEVFGEDLKNLCLWGRREDKFNLADLAPCSNLETLFLSSCTLEEEEAVAALDAATFLPNLKSFTSDSCLGSRSCYFENKSSLIELDLNCSHVGLDIKKGRLMYAKVESVLNQMRDHGIWSRLENLSIKRYTVLSMDVMARLLPQLRRLKDVFVPQTIGACDVLLYESIKRELSSRIPPALIRFNRFESDDPQFMKPCLCFT